MQHDPSRDYTPAQRQALRLIVAFRLADRTLAAHEGDAMRAHGLTPSQFGVLDTLARAGEKGMCVGELTSNTLSTWGNMTVVLRNMERDGLISRSCDPTDARRYLITITEAGRARLYETLPDHARNVERMLSMLSDEEQVRLTELLTKICRG